MGRRETVLIEHADAATRWALERALRRRGLDVLVCPGPGDARHRRCPALTGEGCDLLDRADRVLDGVEGHAGDALMELQLHMPGLDVTRLDPAPRRPERPHSSDRLQLLAALDAALRRRDHAGRETAASG